MVGVDEADVADLGAGLDALGSSFYGEVLDGHYRIAVLQDIAVGVLYYEAVFGFLVRVPLMAAFGAGKQGIQFVGMLALTEGTWGKLGHCFGFGRKGKVF